MSEPFKPDLPARAIDLLSGQNHAHSIAESMVVAYWLHGRDSHTSLYHLNAVHEDFALLAAALGYTISRSDKIDRLIDAASIVLHDIDALVSNSEGVAGLHMNGEVADWQSLMAGGSFGSWLESVEDLRAALPAPVTAVDAAEPAQVTA